jgi:hypothetical protein
VHPYYLNHNDAVSTFLYIDNAIVLIDSISTTIHTLCDNTPRIILNLDDNVAVNVVCLTDKVTPAISALQRHADGAISEELILAFAEDDKFVEGDAHCVFAKKV